ncbi:MAG: thermonuclease family protein [Bacilli bacterium]
MRTIVVYLSFIILIFSTTISSNAQLVSAKAGAKFQVKLVKCIDGDTAEFTKVGKTRFLYIDTPEYTSKKEAFGKEASTFTCNSLKKAKKIELQYDGTKKDKYGRTLAWVWYDNKLIQKELIKRGYVKKFYDYGNYSYEKELITLQSQAQAQKKKVGLWSLSSSTSSTTNQASKPSTSTGTYNFKNCTELRKVFPNGVNSKHSAYKKSMDRDNDGYACER